MTGFYNWLLNETDIGPFHRAIIKKDPGNVHPISYDYAWDSSQDKDRDDWLLSVNKTAGRYISNMKTIRDDFYNRTFSKRYFKEIIENEVEYYRLDSLFEIIINTLGYIQQYTENPGTIHSGTYPHHRDVRWASISVKNAISINYGDLIEFYSSMEDILKKYFQPTILLLIEKVKRWIDSIYRKLHESESDIHGHIIKNYQLEQIPNFVKQILTDIKMLKMFYNNQLPEEENDSASFLSYMVKQIDDNNENIIQLKELSTKETFNHKDIRIVNDLYNDVLSLYSVIRDHFDRKTLKKYKELMGNVAKLLFALTHGVK